MRTAEDRSYMIGRKFGKLTIEKVVKIKGKPHYKCVCDCGATLFVDVYSIEDRTFKMCNTCKTIDVAMRKKARLKADYKTKTDEAKGVWRVPSAEKKKTNGKPLYTPVENNTVVVTYNIATQEILEVL